MKLYILQLAIHKKTISYTDKRKATILILHSISFTFDRTCLWHMHIYLWNLCSTPSR